MAQFRERILPSEARQIKGSVSTFFHGVSTFFHAYIAQPRSGAVGGIPGVRMTRSSNGGSPGLREAIFTSSFNAQSQTGFTDNVEHDHSGQYEYHLSRQPGPRAFWQDVFNRLKPPTAGPATP